jgi:hypothetical protein
LEIMSTPADQRLLELLDKWLKSLELHIRYSNLDADSYWKVQPWPEHERPSRWIIDLAVQKAVALRTQVQERIKLGDKRFSESLELMTFLANLIGSEHIERFIPLADPHSERDLDRAPAGAQRAVDAATGTRLMPQFAPDDADMGPSAAPSAAPSASPSPASPASAESPASPSAAPPISPASPSAAPPVASPAAPPADTGTREMPEFAQATRRAPQAVGTRRVARTERRQPEAKPAPQTAPRQPAKMQPSGDRAREQVISDAARLVQWGRKWYELAELIARMADRPPLTEVRRILKDNKTAIETKAGQTPGS